MVRPPARLNHVAPSWTHSTVVNSLSPSILQFIPHLILSFPDPFMRLSATPPRRKSLSSIRVFNISEYHCIVARTTRVCTFRSRCPYDTNLY